MYGLRDISLKGSASVRKLTFSLLTTLPLRRSFFAFPKTSLDIRLSRQKLRNVLRVRVRQKLETNLKQMFEDVDVEVLLYVHRT